MRLNLKHYEQGESGLLGPGQSICANNTAIQLKGRTACLIARWPALNASTGRTDKPVCGRTCMVQEHEWSPASSSTNGTS